MTVPSRRFQLRIFATVVSKRRAIDDSVSPRLTWYISVAEVSRLEGDTVADPEIARDATASGAAGRAFDAMRGVVARGMTSSWPTRTVERIDSWLASARSERLTFSFRAIVAIDSPRRTVCHLSEASSSGDADASRVENVAAVPAGTLIS